MTTAVLRIAVAGATGRMGRMLIDAVLAAPDTALAGALDVPGCPLLGQDAGAAMGQLTGATLTSDLKAGLQNAQVLIDFTRPEGTLAHLAICRELGVGIDLADATIPPKLDASAWPGVPAVFAGLVGSLPKEVA